MRSYYTIIAFAVAICCSEAQTIHYFNPDGVAIRGYDPVAYFVDSAAVQGTKEFSYTWQGAEWYFRNQDNRDSFKAAPEMYAPQFGGFCAFGASENHKASTDPSAYTIINGKLYLNYSKKVKEVWMKNTVGNIEKAEANWVTLKDQKY